MTQGLGLIINEWLSLLTTKEQRGTAGKPKERERKEDRDQH